MEIILLRHGKPNIPSLHKISACSFADWIDSYNASGLCPTSVPPKNTLSIARECNAVICSDLIRSKESAEALNTKNILLADLQFNEAGLPSASWTALKLSPSAWAVIFRVMWLFGYSNNSESYKEAKSRAEISALKLIELAKDHKIVLFVGHGVYNNLLSKQLKLLGWHGPSNPGTKHWSFGVYKKQ